MKGKDKSMKLKLLIICLFCFLLINGCDEHIEKPINCSDGTLYGRCSDDKPFYCKNGTLIELANICGCQEGYKISGDICKKIIKCEDGTIAGRCSDNKPLYCVEGKYMIERASYCGCPNDEVADGDNCISKFEVSPEKRSFDYILYGKKSSLDLTIYKGVYDYINHINLICYTQSCVDNYDLSLINNNVQDDYLKEEVNKIKDETSNKDDQARIAISLVQYIPYDYGDAYNRYPYAVLYDNKGICGEKSRLLAYFLKELGYGVVLFSYEEENHLAVGIKCDDKYDYKNTGYCFIESTVPSIITDSKGEYVGNIKLDSTPEIIMVGSGDIFDATEEYYDAKEWNRLYEDEGEYLNSYDYNLWEDLVKKYGIEISI